MVNDNKLIGTWKHLKRGAFYHVIADGIKIQCSSYQAFEDAVKDKEWLVYRDIFSTGKRYTRPKDEFLDGRFVKVMNEQKGEVYK